VAETLVPAEAQPAKAEFVLGGRSPDVLTCIANLSNDEVFTPPELARRMLDDVAMAWAEANGGKNIWSDQAVRFLDPFTKSGVFLREIASKLVEGLKDEIPDLQERVNHILTKQVFGIAITQLTAYIARRSLYCSKFANGPHSIVTLFNEGDGYGKSDGHIWFERIEHTWEGGTEWKMMVDPNTGKKHKRTTNGRCRYCGASQSMWERAEGLELHAYPFTHTDNIQARIAEIFGADMKFDVVIGNPPYQLKGGAGGTNDASIYPQFVDQARALDARFLVMVIPSRWLAGGRDMGQFRDSMLKGQHLRRFVDYTKMSTAFPGVDFEGGVGYFIWDRDSKGPCLYTLHLGDNDAVTAERNLDDYDIFVRDTRALTILNKVTAKAEKTMDALVSGDTPFGLATNFGDYDKKQGKNTLQLFMTIKQKREVVWVKENFIAKNRQLIRTWKLLIPKAYGERGAIPANVLGPSIVAPPDSVCSQTYLVIGPFPTRRQARSVQSYLWTRFARFLISLRKITQDVPKGAYSWLPVQEWDRAWTDVDLYKKYGITKDEIAFIESMIRPMGATDE
jgi:site-specific DNA-methyltransferase (adenine-specific)